MRILSHRGYWKSREERNTPQAFERSFTMGFGTETDLRDLNGELVISHDPPVTGALTSAAFFQQHQSIEPSLTLALNVKADGLQALVVPQLAALRDHDAFVFDMSIPDTLRWRKEGVPYFTRHSDVEPDPPLYADAAGVWLDAFHGDWWDGDVIERHLDRGKRVCIVSPELHGREHRAVWDALSARFSPGDDARLMICTDLPEQAREVL